MGCPQRYFISILIVIYGVDCSNILGILYVPSVSHYQAGSALMKILAEKGHNVTVVSPFGEEKPPKNYKDVVLKGAFDENHGDTMVRHLEAEESTWRILTKPTFLYMRFISQLENTLKNAEFQNLLNSKEKFDVVILEEFGSAALKYAAVHFNAPLIMYSPADLNDYVTTSQGNPENPAYTSNFHLPFTNIMTFFERLQSTIYYLVSKLSIYLGYLPSHNELLHKYFPDAPHIDDFVNNVSLVLVNSDVSVYEPLPRVPSIINVGGFHIKKPKPLPKDVQELLDNATNGVIFFSLGSNFKSKFISKEKKELIIRVLSRLNQTVLWKFEEDILGKPDNVIIRQWFPQNDIFAHKNVKLFITQGGIFSTMEAIYNGIPMLFFPIFGDQQGNANRAEKGGYGKLLNFKRLEETQFEETIKELLDNPKYQEAAQQRSRIMRDRPISQADSVNYWVEYVIRHKGAEHLRVASLNLAWYQNLLLDVIAFVVVILFAFIMFLKYFISLILKRMKRKEKTN